MTFTPHPVLWIQGCGFSETSICLYTFDELSTSCYHALRTSGFLKLPSERTLRDYTHYVKANAGFQSDIDDDLAHEVKINELPEWKKYVVLLLDEMKI